jgi:hypothetical protein
LGLRGSVGLIPCVDTWTENLNVYAGHPVHLSTGSVMKSALDTLIEDLEAEKWQSSHAGSTQVQEPTLPPVSLAACRSPHCAGCYDVGEGRKIHPPKCGADFFRWRAWLEGKGPKQ